MSTEESVGVRELRQHLSRYLRRVAAGEVLRVTERGRPVALLGPLPEEAGPVERLRSQGRLQAARYDLLTLGPPGGGPCACRSARRWPPSVRRSSGVAAVPGATGARDAA